MKKQNKSNVFPNIKRVLPTLLANEIVAVQPMAIPKGLLFYMDEIYGNRRRPVRNQKELNNLFRLWEIFEKRYPLGSNVHMNLERVIGTETNVQEQLTITSEYFVLSNMNTVGFLCNKSKDDQDFYYVDDLKEFEEIIKELNENDNQP